MKPVEWELVATMQQPAVRRLSDPSDPRWGRLYTVMADTPLRVLGIEGRRVIVTDGIAKWETKLTEESYQTLRKHYGGLLELAVCDAEQGALSRAEGAGALSLPEEEPCCDS